ncbi:glycosyltransferase [Corynebacterium yudongzhengii]|uniref:Glycosyltransferase n=1 Tax=Corynebacterium yudongzhengii TaxID=2080740 RepID=A0A2U1T9N4_9CORY|nr:glycosyltransferase [Corynebacterium yudongzhengii]AWB81181.1 glycosyltransferase [Corynebacterium yudongzhengii]PWC02720.1 glycosyltransferase [Corynebacterium yudongzhengii]
MWVDYVVKQVATAVPNFLRSLPLMLDNRLSRRRIPQSSPEDVIISLTSHGVRLRHVHLTIESIARGNTTAPIVLWLDDCDYDSEWPPQLRRLVERGLQIKRSDGRFGPHTKYWCTFREVEGTGRRVVTVDDDMIYPEWFLERLLFIAQLRSDCVVAYRAHRIELRDGALLPYRKWTPANTSDASFLHFATGVSGVYYPAAFVTHTVAQGERFLEVSPRADDVWLHLMALRSGHRVRQVFSRPRSFAVNPPAQRDALVHGNTMGGGNDEQIGRAYSDADVERLCAIAKEED